MSDLFDLDESFASAGTKVKVRLIKSKNTKEQRAYRGLVQTVHEGELGCPLEVGASLWVDNSLYTTVVKEIKAVAPGIFEVTTQNSVYELTMPSNGSN